MIGILGGTFDPIHHGHLRLAVEMREGLGLEELRLIPALQPPHREAPIAGAEDRLAMLEAAVGKADALHIDTRELDREGPSYTVDTLASLRAELPAQPLCLIVGMDAFRFLDTWHRWQELLELAHIGIARRPGSTAPAGGVLADLLRTRTAATPAGLRDQDHGLIWVQDVPLLDISGTRIRDLLASSRDPRYLLPDPVLHVIRERGLYIVKH